MLGPYVLLRSARTRRTRYWKGLASTGKAFLIIITYFRSVLHADLLTLNSQQSDIWWRSVHRHRAWFCHHSHIIQYSLLSFRWSEYLHGYEELAPPAVRHHGDMDSPSDLFLAFRLVSLHRPLLVQSPSVLVRRLHHRLPRVLTVDVSWKFAYQSQQLVWLLSTFANDDYWIQEEETRSSV